MDNGDNSTGSTGGNGVWVGTGDNRCQFNKSPVSPRTGFDGYRSMSPSYTRDMLVGHVNLVKVRAPQDYQIGFQSYIEAMAAIALGKAPASEVVERLDQAMREHEAERQRDTAMKNGNKK
ncbi:hypothetical protein QBC36DRAFT_295579 [Triangularia setosa]|uniref:Uncharacterized protein n=1 Tax=Triangularia setosa TaxID=2587417 RepID=A0AAN6VWX0_9PEZI|nr:hypothetical protein QBC36DRAFT_295579 [Podospora setosa]